MKNKRTDQKSGADIKERLCRYFDIQPDVFPNETLVEICGRNRVSIKGAGRVRVYTDKEIRLLCRHGELCVLGERLSCSAYRRGAAVIDGKIISVSFEEVKK